MSENLPEVRRRAWETRRQRYGEKGHDSRYGRPCPQCRTMKNLIVRLHVEGVLSEGQASQAIGITRIELRELADERKNLS